LILGVFLAFSSGILTVAMLFTASIALAVAFGWYLIGSWALKLGPYAKFMTTTMPKIISDIIKSAKNYKGDVNSDIIKQNKKTMKVFFGIFGGMSAIIVIPTIIYAFASMPLISAAIIAAILILTVVLLVSTAWRFTMAAKGASVHKRDNYETITKCQI
jgi:ammonia channel protein AmtB